MDRKIYMKLKEKGQSLVELALTITVLMVLLAGTIDLGHAFFVWLAMRDAAQEGASYGSVKPKDTGGIIARVKDNYAQAIIDPAAIVDVQVTFTDPNNLCLTTNQNTITVKVDYTNFPITMPFIGFFIGNSIPIHAEINDTIIAPCGS